MWNGIGYHCWYPVCDSSGCRHCCASGWYQSQTTRLPSWHCCCCCNCCGCITYTLICGWPLSHRHDPHYAVGVLLTYGFPCHLDILSQKRCIVGIGKVYSSTNWVIIPTSNTKEQVQFFFVGQMQSFQSWTQNGLQLCGWQCLFLLRSYSRPSIIMWSSYVLGSGQWWAGLHVGRNSLELGERFFLYCKDIIGILSM